MANRRYIDFPIASSVGDSDIILIWQSGANKQTTKATFLSGLPENLDELNDVAISGLTNGQILRYDSVTGKWENTDQGNLDLNDLNDVSIVSPSNGQVLVYNSSTSRWENSSGGYVPYTGAVTTVNLGAQTIQAGSFVKAGGTSAQFLKANGSVDSNVYGTGTVTSVALTMPTAFTVGGSPITTAGTLAVTGAGTVGQYIRGDGSLADFPESSGGGSSVSYYLNGSVAQGTIGGVAYKELNKVPILGAGTDFTINADGYIASFITDAGDPNLLEIPAGNWNFETYFSASSGGGSPTFYVELYKVNSGGTATLIASNSAIPELIAFGTNIISYFSTLAVPTTALALTDRLAIRYYVTHSGRTITLHTEDNHLCQIITTFTTGLTALNGLTAQIQNFAVGSSGTDFAIASATATHTFNLPTASATNRGALSGTDWSTFNGKQNALTLTTTGSSGAATLVGATLNIPNYGSALTGYLPLAGGIMTGDITFNAVSGRGIFWGMNSDGAFVRFISTGDSAGQSYLEIGTTDNSDEPIIFTQTGLTRVQIATDGLLKNGSSQNYLFENGGTWGISITGNAGTVTNGVYTSRTITINGTTQDLSANRTFNVGTVTSVTATAGTGISISGSPITSSGTLTITNTAPDQVVSLTASTGISISGSYPNFTITNTSPASASGITGTGTSGKIPIFTGTITIGNSKIDASGSVIYNENPTAGQFAWQFNGSTTTGQSYGANVVAGTNSSDIGFKVMNAAASINYFVVRGDGNVGIGTASPSQKLHITGSGDIVTLTETAAGNFAQYRLLSGATNPWIIGTQSDFLSNALVFRNVSDRMVITTGGNVLIGTTTSGASKLRIVGLPTSAVGLSSGDVYNLSGVLMIA